MNLGSAGVIGSGANSGLHNSSPLQPAGLCVPTAGDGSTGSFKLSSGSVLDGFAMSMPLSAARAAQQLLQVMTWHIASVPPQRQSNMQAASPATHVSHMHHYSNLNAGAGTGPA